MHATQFMQLHVPLPFQSLSLSGVRPHCKANPLVEISQHAHFHGCIHKPEKKVVGLEIAMDHILHVSDDRHGWNAHKVRTHTTQMAMGGET